MLEFSRRGKIHLHLTHQLVRNTVTNDLYRLNQILNPHYNSRSGDH